MTTMSYRRSKKILLAACTAAASVHSQCQAFQSYSSSVSRPFSLGITQDSGIQRNSINTRLDLLQRNGNEVDEHLHPDILAIEKQDDFLKFLEEDDRICIVKFYASWCKSCQKFGQKYRKLAHDVGDQLHPDGSLARTGKVRFAEAEYTVNAKLCKSLKVRKLPTVHMYLKGKGKLVDMTCRPSQFQDVIDEMNRLLSDVEGDEGLAEEGMEDVGVAVPTPFFAGDPNTHVDKTTNEMSFDETMNAGSRLADGILKEVQKKMSKETREEGGKEKTPWFPFSF